MASFTIICGSVFGSAQSLAQALKKQLIEQSHAVHFNHPSNLGDLTDADAILIVTSTTGQGELPANIQPFYSIATESMPLQTDKPFGVIALGDSSYPTFCAAGETMQTLFIELQAKPLLPMLKVDATQTLDPEPMASEWLTKWLDCFNSN